MHEIWKKNLYAIFIAEFAVLMGFSSVLPFMPLFIKEVGQTTNAEAAFWTGIASGGAGLAMFLSAPLWGIVADRWGRKPMLLRAQFGGALTVVLMAFAPNIGTLVVLRIAQGILAGTIAAASALVASQTPQNKLPFSMGLLMVAVFSGTTLGPFLGGLMADSLGYHMTFLITSAIIFLGGFIILFVVNEKFEKATREQATSLSSLWHLATSKKLFMLLVITFAIFAGLQMTSLIIPLHISELSPQAMVATQSGVALGIIGLLSVVSSVSIGRLGERIPLRKILISSCFLGGISYCAPLLAGTVTQFVIFVGLTGLFIGGLQTTSNTLVGLAVPRTQQGMAYGLAASATSLGMGIGALAGGSLSSLIGFRPMFAVTGILFIIVGFLAIKLIKQ